MTTVKLVLLGTVLLTGVAALIVGGLIAAMRRDTHHLPQPQTDEPGR